MERQEHWERIYSSKVPTEVSWYQEHPGKSLELIAHTGAGTAARIIDVGGGASVLVAELLARGFTDLTVLDVSSAALKHAEARLGEADARRVTWMEADITQAALPESSYDVWHDRAVFHFLTDAEDRKMYIGNMERSVKEGGHIIISTFALDGPLRCSGLDIVRYSPESLQTEFGGGFDLLESCHELHPTPFGTQQSFVYCYFRKR
jgi:SAM-dependent methyltransferase